MLIIASKPRQSNGFKSSPNVVSFTCLSSTFFITANLINCIKESIVFLPFRKTFTTNQFLLINESKSRRSKHGKWLLFPFTAKLNFTFFRNYNFQFFPNQLRRQLHFGKGILISEFIQVDPCMTWLTLRKVQRVLLSII